jgi:hypothetical protein
VLLLSAFSYDPSLVQALPSICAESFAGAQQTALDCAFVLLTNCKPDTSLSFSTLASRVIATGFGNSRVAVKRKAMDILLELIRQEQVAEVLPKICETTKHKMMKMSTAALETLTEALQFPSFR